MLDIARLASESAKLSKDTRCDAIERNINNAHIDSIDFILGTMNGEFSERSLDSLLDAALRAGSAKLADRFEAICGTPSDDAAVHIVSSTTLSGPVDRLAWLEGRGLLIAPHAQHVLCSAVENGSVATVELLVKRGASLESPSASAYLGAASKRSNAAML